MPKSDMTEEARKKYVERDFNHCPFCASKLIIPSSDIEADGNEAWQTVKCYFCEREWRDYYKLSGVEVIDLDD